MIDYAAALIAKMRAQFPRGGSGVPVIWPVRLSDRPANEVPGEAVDFVQREIARRNG